MDGRRNPRWSLPALAILTSAAIAAGCEGLPVCAAADRFLRVELRGGLDSQLAPTEEVRRTPSYDAAHAGWKVAALRLPDACLNEGAATATGASRSSQTILQTNCGVWLGELERALVAAGYRVINWSALHLLERQQNLSTYQAAQQLGAEVVFILNSLEANDVTTGGTAGSSIRYFRSDDRGARGQPEALEEEERTFIKAFINERVGGGPATSVVALAATLDLTAIVASNGEAVWFYRKSATKPLQARQNAVFLFAQKERQLWPVEPEGLRRPEIPRETRASEEVFRSEAKGTPQDRYAAERLELVRTVATDFVARFRSAPGGP